MEIISLLLVPLVFTSFIWLLITAFKSSIPWGLLVFFGPIVIAVLGIIIVQPSSVISILLISLVSYLPAIAYAAKHWEAAKKPFLTYMSVSIISLLISVSTLAALGDDSLDQLINQATLGQINEKEAADRMRIIIRKMEESGSLSERDKLSVRTAQNIIKQVEMNLDKDPLYYSRESVEEYEQELAQREAERKRKEKIRKLQEKLNKRVTTDKPPPQKKPKVLPEIKKSEIRKYIGSEVIIVTNTNLQHKGLLKGFDEEEYKAVLEKERKTGKLIFKIHMSDIKKIFLYIED